MKKQLFVFAMILFGTQSYLSAKPVDYNTAKQVAEIFFNGSQVELEYSPEGSMGTPLYYVFNLKETNGFIIVSGDDSQKPIIAYSRSEKYKVPESSRSNQSSQSSHLRLMLDHFNKSMDSLLLQKPELPSQKEIWLARLSMETTAGLKTAAAVSPLITSRWGQELGSYADQVGNCPAGCVATAIGQIMYSYGFPEHGTGSRTLEDSYGVHHADFGSTYYNWENMGTESTDNEYVSELLYHISIAVNSQFSPGGTGATTAFMINSIPKYFNYKSSMAYHEGIGMDHPMAISNDSAIALIKSQLDNGKPVILSGTNPSFPSGHAIVCDGYEDQNGFLHINWGWNGSNNGYYDFAEMNEWAIYGIVYDIEPDQDPASRDSGIMTHFKSYNPSNLYPCGTGTWLPQQLNDFNRNGFLDLFIKNRIMFNEGGDFTVNNNQYLSGDPFNWNDVMDAADITDDRITDYLLTGLTGTYGSFSDAVHVCTGSEDNSFNPLQLESFPDGTVEYLEARFLDLIGDEKQDILISYGEIIDNSVVDKGCIYENVDGQFVKATLSDFPAHPLYSSGWDIDEDGQDELFGVDYGDRIYYRDPYVNFYKITEDGFELLMTVPLTCDNMTTIDNRTTNRFSDLDHDGIPELISRVTELRVMDNLGYYFQSVRIFRMTDGVFREYYRIEYPSEIHTSIVYRMWTPSIDLADYNADGYMDIVVIWNLSYNYCIDFLTNDSGTGFIRTKEYPDQVNADNMAWGDFDNNGYMDLFLPRTIYKNSLNPVPPQQNALPDPPGLVEAVQVDRDLQINWSEASDDLTPPAGLTYNLRVGTTEGSGDIVSPNKSPGTGNMLFNTSKTLKNMDDCKYYIQVQAFDHSMLPGNWSTVSSAVVTTSEGITFEENDVMLSVSESFQLIVEEIAGTSSTGKSRQTVSIAAEDYLWTSSNTEVAHVSESGLVTAIQSGYAVIKVQNPGNLSQIATCIVTVSTGGITTRVPEINDKSEIRVYPNPSSGEIYVELPEYMISNPEILVVNQYGAIVLREGFSGRTRAKVDLSQLPEGLYLVTVQSKNHIYSTKVLKQSDITGR